MIITLQQIKIPIYIYSISVRLFNLKINPVVLVFNFVMASKNPLTDLALLSQL